MQNYLASTDIIDYTHPAVRALAEKLSARCADETELVKTCFEYVRDQIRHTGDYRDNVTTCKASEVLEQGTGWCYAKSHLLAALLRANGIPTGFCYQRLSCSEYRDDIYCLHGLNAVYLSKYGWYRIDARGNKEGVNALFDPPHERLAFALGENEYSLDAIFDAPLQNVVDALQQHADYQAMVENFPDI